MENRHGLIVGEFKQTTPKSSLSESALINFGECLIL